MIIWEDPPARPVNRSGGCPPERSRRDWYGIAAHLRDRPGQWARATTAPSKTTASSIAGYINRGLNAVLGAGFEATSRTVDGEYRVYVRYVGGAGSEATPNDLSVGPGSTSPEPGPATGGGIGCWPPMEEEFPDGPCERCRNRPSVGRCCSSHSKELCHRCYRITHFVEACSAGCERCAAEQLPPILTRERAAESTKDGTDETRERSHG